MQRFSILSVISIIFLATFLSAANAFFGFFKAKSSVISKTKVETRKDAGDLRFAFVSDMHMYPVPTSQETFNKAPKSKVGIMYQESQVLFQELVRDSIKAQNGNQLDFILFGGSQVANNYHWDLYLDIVDELAKNFIKYYYLPGDGEYLGPNKVEDTLDERFWLRKIKGVNILAIDNARKLVYEKEKRWLSTKIKELEADQDDLLVFSYRPLGDEIKSIITKLPNLKLLANSYDLKYKLIQPFNIANSSSLTNFSQNYTYLSNPALSVYPCAYTVITRKRNGEIIIETLTTSLKGVQKTAKDELKALGFNPDGYEI